MVDFKINSGNDEEFEETSGVEAPAPVTAADPTSPLAALRARRAEIVDDLYIDVPSDKVTLHVDGESVKAKLVEFETMEVGPANA